jgi:hypothetical protein
MRLARWAKTQIFQARKVSQASGEETLTTSNVRDRNNHEKSISVQPGQQRLTDIAKNTLDFFETVAEGARAGLETIGGPTVSALAVVNTLTADRAAKRLREISDDMRRDLVQLSLEPAIARIVVLNDDDEESTVFISRATPQGSAKGGTLWASYHAPMGRLAAIPVGHDHEVKTPAGVRTFEIQERAVLRPTRTKEGWDSKDSIVQGRDYGPLTVRSLREVLRSVGAAEDGLDLLESLLEQDRRATNVLAGIQRSVIEKMGLRDQPLLDEYQDEIFRLPLDSRIVILGPPGTGKTTTLIKRLGLKLDDEYLEQEERELIDRSIAGPSGHAYSWLMFTPTELLKQYIKEAFGRENIAASDLRIQTWESYRRELARNKLGILRTATGRGYVLNDDLQSLHEDTFKQQTSWFADLENWQASLFWSDLRIQAERLATNSDRKIAALGARLSNIVASAGGATQTTPLLALNEVANEVTKLAASTRADVDSLLRQAFARELKRDNQLLDDLLAYLETLGSSVDAVEEFGDSDAEDEEDGDLEDSPRTVPHANIGRRGHGLFATTLGLHGFVV